MLRVIRYQLLVIRGKQPPPPRLLRNLETRSLPALTHCFPRNFTFYVAHPIRSIREQAGVMGVVVVPARRVAKLVFWAIVGGQEVRRRKVSLRCAPKPVRRWCRIESQNQL
jgi:hypothetical protein